MKALSALRSSSGCVSAAAAAVWKCTRETSRVFWLYRTNTVETSDCGDKNTFTLLIKLRDQTGYTSFIFLFEDNKQHIFFFFLEISDVLCGWRRSRGTLTFYQRNCLLSSSVAVGRFNRERVQRGGGGGGDSQERVITQQLAVSISF